MNVRLGQLSDLLKEIEGEQYEKSYKMTTIAFCLLCVKNIKYQYFIRMNNRDNKRCSVVRFYIQLSV